MALGGKWAVLLGLVVLQFFLAGVCVEGKAKQSLEISGSNTEEEEEEIYEELILEGETDSEALQDAEIEVQEEVSANGKATPAVNIDSDSTDEEEEALLEAQLQAIAAKSAENVKASTKVSVDPGLETESELEEELEEEEEEATVAKSAEVTENVKASTKVSVDSGIETESELEAEEEEEELEEELEEEEEDSTEVTENVKASTKVSVDSDIEAEEEEELEEEELEEEEEGSAVLETTVAGGAQTTDFFENLDEEEEEEELEAKKEQSDEEDDSEIELELEQEAEEDAEAEANLKQKQSAKQSVLKQQRKEELLAEQEAEEEEETIEEVSIEVVSPKKAPKKHLKVHISDPEFEQKLYRKYQDYVSIQDFRHYVLREVDAVRRDFYIDETINRTEERQDDEAYYSTRERDVYGYFDKTTERENDEAFDRYKLRPRLQKKAGDPDVGIKMLGHFSSFPLGIAPIPFLEWTHPDGEIGVAQAAQSFIVPMIVSAFSNTYLEEIRFSAPHAKLWMETYIFKDGRITENIVNRADVVGYQAIVVTVDAPVYSSNYIDWRSDFVLPTYLRVPNIEDHDVNIELPNFEFADAPESVEFQTTVKKTHKKNPDAETEAFGDAGFDGIGLAGLNLDVDENILGSEQFDLDGLLNVRKKRGLDFGDALQELDTDLGISADVKDAQANAGVDAALNIAVNEGLPDDLLGDGDVEVVDDTQFWDGRTDSYFEDWPGSFPLGFGHKDHLGDIKGHLLGEDRTKFSFCIGSYKFEEYFEYLVDPDAQWKDFKHIRDLTDLPLVAKGILTGCDAREAVRNGANAIIVSNNGGRRLDETPATIEALAEVVEALDHHEFDHIEIYLDGGVRFGTDIFKAVAIGADGVFIGRPIAWGSLHSGKNGAQRVLQILRKEFDRTMTFMGAGKVDDIVRSMVVSQNYYFYRYESDYRRHGDRTGGINVGPHSDYYLVCPFDYKDNHLIHHIGAGVGDGSQWFEDSSYSFSSYSFSSSSSSDILGVSADILGVGVDVSLSSSSSSSSSSCSSHSDSIIAASDSFSWSSESSISISESSVIDVSVIPLGVTFLDSSLVDSSASIEGVSLIRSDDSWSLTLIDIHDGISVGVHAGVGAHVEASAAVDAGVSVGVGIEADFEIETDFEAETDIEAGFSADISAGFGADIGAGFGVDIDAGFGADVRADLEAGLDISAGIGADLEAGLDLSAGISADLEAGLDLSAGIGAKLDAEFGASLLELEK